MLTTQTCVLKIPKLRENQNPVTFINLNTVLLVSHHHYHVIYTGSEGYNRALTKPYPEHNCANESLVWNLTCFI